MTNWDNMMQCFNPRVRRYQKGEFLLLAGYENHEVGIVLEGSITAMKNTPDGASVAITHMGPARAVRGCAVRFQPAQPGECDGRQLLSGHVPALPQDHPSLPQPAREATAS